ncbi:hypothetical protein [Moritella viscosa]|uniref:Uncharacterized protein n=1 Tax=Moritella viscosa TaxID=80854 RepID=A0A1L0E033_9GAMM|nr:hypothetical protein [Moritella viscosa]SGY95945.1 Putative uncharacterized protein [Moritella viscosa]
MDWKHIKIIVLIVGMILIAALSFVIGVSFGVTFEEGSLTDTLIPILGVMGSWVAGLGALAAVFTSLWLAEQQRKNNIEKLKSAFDVCVFSTAPDDMLAVSITCIGNKPSNLNSISIRAKDCEVALGIAQFDIQGNRLPMSLSYGEQGCFILPLNSETSIKDYVKKHCSGSYKNVDLYVNTSTKSFRVPFNNTVVEYLKK